MPVLTKPNPFAEFQADPRQVVANKKQIELYRRFQSAGADVFHGNMDCHDCKVGEIFKDKNFIIAKEANVVFHQAVIFLWLKAMTPEGHSMRTPPKIDAIWHFFILCTEAYRKFGERVGGFIDHTPYTMRRSFAELRKPQWMPEFKHIEEFMGHLAKDGEGNLWLIEEWWEDREPHYPLEVWGECG